MGWSKFVLMHNTFTHEQLKDSFLIFELIPKNNYF